MVFGLFTAKRDAKNKKSPATTLHSPLPSSSFSSRPQSLATDLTHTTVEGGKRDDVQGLTADLRADALTSPSKLPTRSHKSPNHGHSRSNHLPSSPMPPPRISTSSRANSTSTNFLDDVPLDLSPIKMDMRVFEDDDEDEDNRPLGATPPMPSQSPSTSHSRPALNPLHDLPLPPSRTSLFARSARPGSERGDSDLDGLAGSTRSLPIQASRPILSSVFSSPEPPPSPVLVASPTALSSSSGHLPLARSISPVSQASSRLLKSKFTRTPKEPLLKLSLGEPIQLNPESESRSKLKKEKPTAGGGMFGLMRNRRKSSAADNSPTDEKKGRPSISSSKSEGAVMSSKDKNNSGIFSDPVLVPPVPALPPLRPIPVGQEFTRPSQANGFEPPVRRGKLVPPPPPEAKKSPPPAATSSVSLATSNGTPQTVEPAPPIEEGTFELKSFRHVRPVSPGPNTPVSGRASPAPFQGLELVSDPTNPTGRARQDSVASEASTNAKTTVAAFRQAQQRRTSIEGGALARRSTADLFEESQQYSALPSPVIPVASGSNSRNASQTYLPLPGPPPPPPPVLEMPKRPFAAASGPRAASPSPSLPAAKARSQHGHQRTSSETTPPRPPRMHPPPPHAKGAWPAAQGRQVKSAYGKLYGVTSSSEEESDEDEADDSDDDAPLAVRSAKPGVLHNQAQTQVVRKRTITQKSANVTKSDAHMAPPSLVLEKSSPVEGTNEGSGSGKKRQPGSIIPPPRSSSLFADTKIKASDSSKTITSASVSSRTNPSVPVRTVLPHSQSTSKLLASAPRAQSVVGDRSLTSYASSKGSRSMSAFIPESISEFGEKKRSGVVHRRKDSESDSTEESEGGSSTDDDAPLASANRVGGSSASLSGHGSAPRAKNVLSMRGGNGWASSATKSDLGHGAPSSVVKRPPLVVPAVPPKKGSASGTSSPATAITTYTLSSASPTSPPSITRPPRDARRTLVPRATAPAASNPARRISQAPPAVTSRSADNVKSILSQQQSQSQRMTMLNQPPSRPFVTAGLYTSSPGGSSNGDSYSSSGRGLPITPRDGSEVGTNSGSSALGGTVGRRSGESARLPTSVPMPHRRKGSVTFEEPVKEKVSGKGGSNLAGSEEQKRMERRRNEAKNAIQMGNAINGPPPNVSDDDDALYLKQRAPQLPNLNLGGQLGMGWDPQLLMMLQAQQQQQAQILQMTMDPALYNAHHQAMLLAKQAYQLTVAQQAMEAAGEEWERSSNMGGPTSSVISGFGGSSSLLNGMGGGLGMNPMGMGMMTPSMSMPTMNPYMGMGPMSMFFPTPSATASYAGSTAGSTYGVGMGPRSKNVAFPGSASSYGPSEDPVKARTRQRTNTAPSKGPLPIQHSSRTGVPVMPPPPPSSWRS